MEKWCGEVLWIGWVSCLPAQYGAARGRFGLLMTQDGLHCHQRRPLIQQRAGQGMPHGMCEKIEDERLAETFNGRGSWMGSAPRGQAHRGTVRR
jgi:hypothetical protein